MKTVWIYDRDGGCNVYSVFGTSINGKETKVNPDNTGRSTIVLWRVQDGDWRVWADRRFGLKDNTIISIDSVLKIIPAERFIEYFTETEIAKYYLLKRGGIIRDVTSLIS